MSEKLLTAKQVSSLLAIDICSIYRLASKPDGLPSIKIGRRLRFKKSSISAWIDQQQKEEVRQCSGS
ncbi:MAG: helix-turn-helix domain-containing protein [Nitrospiraceae bacterium]|nr:helix-turn-helix domain-containing protein [Nitrospiraceae bacterium]